MEAIWAMGAEFLEDDISHGLFAAHSAAVFTIGEVAPTVKDQLNAVRQSLVTVGCASLPDSHFDFDSSFILPDVRFGLTHGDFPPFPHCPQGPRPLENAIVWIAERSRLPLRCPHHDRHPQLAEAEPPRPVLPHPSMSGRATQPGAASPHKHRSLTGRLLFAYAQYTPNVS
jgi:hypothetical protein